jgi:MSHA pilin protein MshD
MNQQRKAFTLIEACIAMVVVAVMLVAAMTVAGNSARARFAQQEMSRGQCLARQLLAEIVQNSYEQPGATTTTLGPEPAETRATFNDIDDFNGSIESPPADASGTLIPGYSGWTRSVLVEWVAPTTSADAFVTSATETGLKRITVTVTSPFGKGSTAVALRSRFGAYDKQQDSQKTYTSWIGVTLQIGSNPSTIVSGGVNPFNQVP